VRPFWQRASVLAVPLETGGGTRIKILESFAAGVPVVSTPIGCEGINGRHGEHLLVASREQFADALTTVLMAPAAAAERAVAARQLAEQEYDWRAIGARAAEQALAAAGDGRRCRATPSGVGMPAEVSAR